MPTIAVDLEYSRVSGPLPVIAFSDSFNDEFLHAFTVMSPCEARLRCIQSFDIDLVWLSGG